VEEKLLSANANRAETAFKFHSLKAAVCVYQTHVLQMELANGRSKVCPETLIEEANRQTHTYITTQTYTDRQTDREVNKFSFRVLREAFHLQTNCTFWYKGSQKQSNNKYK